MNIRDTMHVLTLNGYSPIFRESSDPNLEDHCIEITEKVHIGVSAFNPSISWVIAETPNERYKFFPERADRHELLADLHDAVKTYG